MGGGFLPQYKIVEYPEGEDDYIQEGDYYYEDYEGDYYEEGEDYNYHNAGADTNLFDNQVDERDRRRQRQAEDIVYENSSYFGGGVQTDKAWMFDGYSWKKIAPMSIARDRPACSIINMPNGKVMCQLSSLSVTYLTSYP